MHDHPPQSRVRVDEAALAERDKQVMLRRSGRDEDHVAPRAWTGRSRKSRPFGKQQVRGDRAVAQAVTGRRRDTFPKSAGDQTHAIDAAARISSAETEWRTFQGGRVRGKKLRRHRGIG